MDTGTHSDSDAPGSRADSVSDVHNASVDEDVARRGACAQVHLPTGATCTLRHGHKGSCEFSPPEQADAVLAERRAAEHW
jgi:hypothetical protein